MNTGKQWHATQDLLAHESFVRNVVRGLLSDDASVQDVLQETWVRALDKLPETVQSQGSLRAWLTRVSSNLALSWRRSDGRRIEREAGVARTESDNSWERSAQRVEDRQRVAESILSLPEPYRTVVLLRYEEELTPGQIGQRLGSSAATVRSQLSRAHELMRVKLDGEFGDRRTWAALALPVVGLRRVSPLAPFVLPSVWHSVLSLC